MQYKTITHTAENKLPTHWEWHQPSYRKRYVRIDLSQIGRTAIICKVRIYIDIVCPDDDVWLLSGRGVSVDVEVIIRVPTTYAKKFFSSMSSAILSNEAALTPSINKNMNNPKLFSSGFLRWNGIVLFNGIDDEVIDRFDAVINVNKHNSNPKRVAT